MFKSFHLKKETKSTPLLPSGTALNPYICFPFSLDSQDPGLTFCKLITSSGEPRICLTDARLFSSRLTNPFSPAFWVCDGSHLPTFVPLHSILSQESIPPPFQLLCLRSILPPQLPHPHHHHQLHKDASSGQNHSVDGLNTWELKQTSGNKTAIQRSNVRRHRAPSLSPP